MKFQTQYSFKEWLAILRNCKDININSYVPSCEHMRECLMELLVEYETLTKAMVTPMLPDIEAYHLDFLGTCIGHNYESFDWMLLFSLCNFDDGCFEKELYARRYQKNHPIPDINGCNLQAYYDQYQIAMAQTGICFKFRDLKSCKALPYDAWKVGCEDLELQIKAYLCTEDPLNYFDRNTNIFNKGLYLEKLHGMLNIYYGVSLSICDYEMILESCSPCCLGNFFKNLNFAYVHYYFYKRNYDASNSINCFSIDPKNLPFSSFGINFNCNNSYIFCSRVKFCYPISMPINGSGSGTPVSFFDTVPVSNGGL
ncbi:MAG: hypothetical protein ACOVP5_07455, partial [Chitinophagales bacterium]